MNIDGAVQFHARVVPLPACIELAVPGVRLDCAPRMYRLVRAYNQTDTRYSTNIAERGTKLDRGLARESEIVHRRSHEPDASSGSKNNTACEGLDEGLLGSSSG